MNIQWYPGHMTKTRRQIEADLGQVDMVAEIIDARIPVASRNPDIDVICAGKPRLIVLNRADQADPEGNRGWGRYFRGKGPSLAVPLSRQPLAAALSASDRGLPPEHVPPQWPGAPAGRGAYPSLQWKKGF